ncbi:MAG: hypothetical protein ACWGQW_19470 [bacterium]
MAKPDRRRKLWVVEYLDNMTGEWYAGSRVAPTRKRLRQIQLQLAHENPWLDTRIRCYVPRDETD